MIFITGGRGSGKLARIKELGYGDGDILYCASGDTTPKKAVYRLNELLRTESGETIERLIDCAEVIACDETGCGIVPLEKGERELRERAGRLCCDIAKRADRVERMVCGIPEVIKGI